MHAWIQQQPAATTAACTPGMLRHAPLCSCNTADGTKLPLHIGKLTSRARRPLPKPPCGETRSANRTRWAGNGEAAAVAASTAPAASDLDSVQQPQQCPAVSPQPHASAVGGARQDAAEQDPLGMPVNQIAVQPPLATGNEEPPLSIPATPEAAASLVHTCLWCALCCCRTTSAPADIYNDDLQCCTRRYGMWL
jgi:hypothetical protein